MASAERIESAVVSPPAPRWSTATRVAFRFSVVYLGLTILSTQLFSAVFMLPSPQFLTGVNDLLVWVGTHLFQISDPIPVELTGSGDTLLNWVLAGTLLIIAACVTAVWSLVSRRDNYPRMNMWFRLLVRFALGATLVRYVETVVRELIIRLRSLKPGRRIRFGYEKRQRKEERGRDCQTSELRP